MRILGTLLTLGLVVGHVLFVRRARLLHAGGASERRAIELWSMATIGAGVLGAVALGGLLSSTAFLTAGAVGLILARILRLDLVRILDAAGYAFPFGWVIVRLGCAWVHDHPGVRTTSLLAVRFADGLRHDLGLLETLGTGAIAIAVVALDRAVLRRRPGATAFFVFAAYALVRFVIEFLREPGAGFATRWFGLDLVQWAILAVAAVAAGTTAAFRAGRSRR
jgi:phosphatidylglycerol:prolipoprotein diacylglycerol transferase